MYVHTRKPMCLPERKLLTRTRQKPSVPVLELHCGFPRKSISRSLASFARNMGVCILCTLPRIAAGTKRTGH
jgi:hypothetical protein